MSEPEGLAKVSWQDPSTGQTKEFVLSEGATASIGRSPGNDICIPERHVSRQHAVINYRDGVFMISDLGSANGTFVNDQRLTDPFPLFSGDVVRLFVPILNFSAVVTEEDQINATTQGTLIVPPAAGGVAKLQVTSGPQEGAEIPLSSELMTVGRATQNAVWDIALQDRAVSRPHAKLVYNSEDRSWAIVDMESANGTLVNGVPVTEPAGVRLKDGDVLTLGETMILFRAG